VAHGGLDGRQLVASDVEPVEAELDALAVEG
jgi:hypothetical protein